MSSDTITESGLSDFSHFCPADSLIDSPTAPSSSPSNLTTNKSSSVRLRPSSTKTSGGTTWFARRMAKSNSVALTETTRNGEDSTSPMSSLKNQLSHNSPVLCRNSLPDEAILTHLNKTHPRGYCIEKGNGGDRNSSPIDVPMLHLLSLQKELDVLKDCVSKHGTNFSSPDSSADDLSILEEDFPKPRPPPLVVDEPFNILSVTPAATINENVIFPLQEYSVQVEPFYNPSSYSLTDSDSSLNDNQDQPRPSTPPTLGLKRQGSFEYDHLEDIPKESNNHVSTPPPLSTSNSGYFVAVQFSEEENKDIKTSTLATLCDDSVSSRKSSFISMAEEPQVVSTNTILNPPNTCTCTNSTTNNSQLPNFLTLQHGKPSPINARSSRLSHSIPGRLDSPSFQTLSEITTDHAQFWSSTSKLGSNSVTMTTEKCHCPSCCSCGSSTRKLSFDRGSGHSRQTSFESTPPPSLPPYSCPLKRYKTYSLKNSPKLNSVSPLVSNRIERVRSDDNYTSSKINNEISRPSLTAGVPSNIPTLPTHVSISTPIVTTHTSSTDGPTDVPTDVPSDVPGAPPSSGGDPETQSLWSIPSHYSIQSSTTGGGGNSMTCCDRVHIGYHNGIDVNVFKQRIDLISQWFGEFSDSQRNILLQKLLEQCNCSQMHMLSLQMEPILHEGCPHNCQDLLSWLPPDISLRILSFLDPVSLCRVSQVSHGWFVLANDTNLWKQLCLSPRWHASPCGLNKLIDNFTSSDGLVQWKALFIEMFRLRRNWLKGYCTVRTFEGHSQGISCVQFDDTRIVSGSWDKTIKVWNRRTNTAWAALTLAGHSGTVRCLHLHNNRLVSGSSDRTIKVWDLATNNVGWIGAACRATMTGHLHTVRCLQADDSKVVSGSYDHTVKVWDLKTGQCTMTLRGHTDAVLCLQFDKTKVISGSKDTTIKLWTLSDGQCRLSLYGHEGAVTCLQFDDSRIISGALDRLIKIWDLTTGQCLHTMDWIKSEGHTGVVRHLQADSWKIISAADDKTLKVWSVRSGERLLTLKSHTDGVTCLQFNDQVIVSGSYDKSVKLWDFSVC